MMIMTVQDKASAMHLSLAAACIDAVRQGEKPGSPPYRALTALQDKMLDLTDCYRSSAFQGEDILKASAIFDRLEKDIERHFRVEKPKRKYVRKEKTA